MDANDSGDSRLALLTRWLREDLGFNPAGIEPASADASFRRYFRVTRDNESFIIMDAPPVKEDLGPYLKVTALLADIGLNVPWVLARDVSQGLLLLTDLGTRLYLPELTHVAAAAGLYKSAFASLARMQSAGRAGAAALPPYDAALLTREMQLVADWFLAKHLQQPVGAAERALLEQLFKFLVQTAIAQPATFVHRDFHSRNLMVTPDSSPGIIDFQDAVKGPVTYDLVSLLRDAYIAWDEERQIDWAVRYWERARAAGVPVGSDFGAFWRDFEWMGVQRQLKVLGIFARLWHRDGKAVYLQEMPRVMAYLRGACARYRALGPLLKLLDELEGRRATVGYTF